MEQILTVFRQTKEYQKSKQAMQRRQTYELVGLPILARAFVAAALYRETEGPVLLLTTKEEEAQKLRNDLAAILGEEDVLFFPSRELLPYQNYTANRKVEAARLPVLGALAKGEKKLITASANVLLRKLPPPSVHAQASLSIQIGQRWPREQLLQRLLDLGYQREKLAEEEGTFSSRGDLLDLYAAAGSQPVRLEFFDDTLESMRYFDAQSQRSQEKIDAVTVLPAKEMLLAKEQLQSAGQKLQKELAVSAAKLPASAQKKLFNRYQSSVDLLCAGVYQEEVEQFLPYFYKEDICLLDYFTANATVILNEPDTIHKTLQQNQQAQKDIDANLLEQGQILPSFADNFYDMELVWVKLAEHPLLLLAYLPEKAGFRLSGLDQMAMEEPLHYTGRLEQLKEDCAAWQKKGYRIFATASTEIRRNRLRQLFAELQMPATILAAPFGQGFIAHALKLLVLTEKELLGADTRAKVKRKIEGARKIDTFLDLAVGDYVVHLNHGIGRYLGVERLKVGDGAKDYLHIQYQGADKLYVPADQLDMVQKYIGNDSQAPKLNKLGGGEWQRAKNKVRQAVADMAKELLVLYSAREAVQRPDFGPDTPWQQEFEDSFPYTETPDQLQAAAEIKADMQKPQPMDRLLCGDVGYGKTEVALRAAFKAVMAGRQVAVLVPTTILAQQHLLTFQERLAGYPVKIAVYSRFTSMKEQKEIKRDLVNGQIDIVIGTHKLLGRDIAYRNLGLLIVDEEQRFGVAHKEKIKTLKNAVDVLTLSATPIPRTLHMALLGIRDMSIINSPPEDRQAVQTAIVEEHPLLLQETINRELARGGQVYFVHNRVFNISAKAQYLRNLVPQAKIAVAHGRMAEKELEDVMSTFIAGENDVLLCTTIIESGLDIPNVNTLIVDDADTFGLAQLYQLRGRVGRAGRQAYAYFTYAPDRIINENARKRLAAIRDFTELGSGFKIAVRDMEIRGVGNLLGPQQHGHIAAVGFDMYCRLVEEEMLAQKGEQSQERDVPLLELELNAFLPDDYVDDPVCKIEIYKKLAAAQSFAEIDGLESELRDRYGKLPEPAQGLLRLGKIKVQAQDLSLKSITQNQERFTIRIEKNDSLSAEVLLQLSQQYLPYIRYKQQQNALLIYLSCKKCHKQQALDLLTEFLTAMHSLIAKKTVIITPAKYDD